MNEFRAKNHYIPKLYLKQWEDGSTNKVCVYKTLVSHRNERIWKKYSTGAIAYQKHLYTQVISGAESDELEHWLDKRYESPAKEAIEKATSDRRLSRDDWDALIRFLACQDVRTPARLLEHLNRGRGEHQKLLQDAVEQAIQDLEKELGTPAQSSHSHQNYDKSFPLKLKVEPDKNGEMGARLKVESYIGRATWIHSIKHLLTDAEKVLHKHKWSIVKPAKGYSWFTSDNPVVKLNFKNNNNYDLGGGWGRKKGNIIFPLGPQHAMFVQIGDNLMLNGKIFDENKTKQLRRFIAENSHRMIFSNSFDPTVPSLKPRKINPEEVIRERQQLKDWHEQNKKLESEFF